MPQHRREVTPRERDGRPGVAEREGFEPSIRFWRILTFQASAFDHSATAPHTRMRRLAGEAGGGKRLLERVC